MTPLRTQPRQLRALLAAVERGDLEEPERESRLVPRIEGAVAVLEVIAELK